MIGIHFGNPLCTAVTYESPAADQPYKQMIALTVFLITEKNLRTSGRQHIMLSVYPLFKLADKI